MIGEDFDRRVLGAVRFVDANTGLWVREPLQVDGGTAKLLQNRSGTLVITGAPGFADYIDQFEKAPVPPAASLDLTLLISDPRGKYLARRSVVKLPRDPDPAHASAPGSLFRPVEVALYPTPAAATVAGSAVIRASIEDQNGQGINGALLVVTRVSDQSILARGLSDARGEALVGVPNIPVTTWGAGAGSVIATQVDATLTVLVDQSAPSPPDPDQLEAKADTLPKATVAIKLVSGTQMTVKMTVGVA